MSKILIIEDDKFLSELLATKLTKEGFNVISAPNGEDGVIKTKSEKPEIILLDLMLPQMDGFEVMTNLKKDPVSSNIPIIILSNFGQEEKIEKGLALGAKDYLVKANFTTAEIVAKIKKTLGQ